MPRVWLLPATLVAGLALAACSGTPHSGDVKATARAFVAKLAAGQGNDACAMLTEDARSSVPGATDQSCAQAIVNVKEKGTAVGGVEVWGDAAQVHIGGDVLFLRLVSGKWKVSAAGCTAKPGAPYECEVGG